MLNLNKIPKNEQEGFISSFWSMLRECEVQADKNNDIVLKHHVTEWYKQWNRITNDNKVPIWVTRKIPLSLLQDSSSNECTDREYMNNWISDKPS